jgi:hypothetical protein
MRHHLTTLLQGFKRNPSAGVVYGRALMKTTGADFVLGDAFDIERLQKTNFIPNCAALIRRDVIDPIGWFDPAVVLKRICDYDFWCRAAEQFPFAFCPEVVAEEHGVALADSLGNSVTLSARLAEKYRRSDRNTLLNPANYRQWDPFAPPDWMDDSERNEFCFLVFEHFIRIKQIVKGARLVCRTFPGRFPGRKAQNGDGDDYLVSAVFDWYLDGASRSRLALQMQLIEAHRYIDRLDGQLQNRFRAAVVKRLPQSLRGWARVP